MQVFEVVIHAYTYHYMKKKIETKILRLYIKQEVMLWATIFQNYAFKKYDFKSLHICI